MVPILHYAAGVRRVCHTSDSYASVEEGEDGFALEVLRYFLRNPDATDNLEGIARWRLTEENIHRTVKATRRALRALVAKGYLVERRSAVAGTLFSLNPSARCKSEEFAERTQEKDSEEP